MSIITIPDDLAVARQSWGQMRNVITGASAFGGSQSLEASHPWWSMSLAPPLHLDAEASAFQALMLGLKGHQNLLACHNLRRPQPLGTMRGTMTLSADVSAGAGTMEVIAADQPGTTLLAGDYLGIGVNGTQQVVMLTAGAVADGSGVIEIAFESVLRTAFSAGEVVTWDKPKALFRRVDTSSSWDYDNVIVSGMSMSFIEDWRV